MAGSGLPQLRQLLQDHVANIYTCGYKTHFSTSQNDATGIQRQVALL
jgi:hypothetical protein